MRGRPAGPAATLFDYASGRECLQMIDEMKRMRTSGERPVTVESDAGRRSRCAVTSSFIR